MSRPAPFAFREEEVYWGRLPVRYLLQRPPGAGADLVVVFAGMNPPPPEPAKYSYVRTLKDLRRNKLFILDDYGPRGCYYLGKNRILDFEDEVIDLIDLIAVEVGVTLAVVTACGSSKGGFASLYYAIKYGFGRAVVGGPQTRVGDYLTSPRGTFDKILEWVAGERSESSREWLNALLPEAIAASPHRPHIDVHVGRGDHHLDHHVKPFLRMLDEQGGFA
jgi:hypothetical protein